ncbi:MAG: hypothetical protein GVY16_03090 [Planctomycetes bacterium]|jgi:flagellar biosynthesis chaperone FliJ|nr:hypothetical protein [Phycisphaerae bacterium]NBB94704.1 hypothetical protein [Planctomycetota bacterium]
MATSDTLGTTVLQLRLQEERTCRDDMAAAQHRLDEARRQIHDLQEQADAYYYAAIVSQAEGQTEAAATYRRRRQQYTVERRKRVAELAAAKVQFGQSRESLLAAMKRRSQLSLDEARHAV